MEYKNGMLFHDRYSLERLIGRGAFSEVWLSKDTKTGIQVAIKIFAPATGLDEDGLSLFAREFSLVVNLNDGHILKPLHFDTCDRNPYLVLPYFSNGSVQKRVGLFKEDEVWKLIHDVASGLKYLHASQPAIIHQDIKPDNIMLADDGQYVLSDFGISSHCRSVLRKSVSESFGSAGTTAYMGPERFGKQSGTPIMASDIYSLGATVYELITGTTPFGDDGGLIQKKGADIPDIVEPCSYQLKKVIAMCLDSEPWKRPTAAQLVDYSEKAIKGELILFESVKRKFKIIIPAAVAILIAVFFVVKVFNQRSQEREIQAFEELEKFRIQDSLKMEMYNMIKRADNLVAEAAVKEPGYDDMLIEARNLYFQAIENLSQINDIYENGVRDTIDSNIAFIDTCLTETMKSLSEKMIIFADDNDAIQEFSSRFERIKEVLDYDNTNLDNTEFYPL